MLIMGAFALYMRAGTLTTTVDAAAVLSDEGLPRFKSGVMRRRRYPIPYEIKGHLLNSEAVTIEWRRERWTYAPLVPENGGPTDHPRLVFAATEASYKRSRAENRFVCFLERDDAFGTAHRKLEEAGMSPAPDAYFLEDNGALRAGAASSFSLMMFALVGGVASLVVLFVAFRRARADDDDDA